MNKDEVTVARRQLGRRLKALREEAHISMAQVQTGKYASTTKLWRMESGLVPIKIGDVLALARLYGLSGETTNQLAAMAEASDQSGCWQEHDVGRPLGFHLFLGLESTASRISSYESETLPGLLQTRDSLALSAPSALTADDSPEQIPDVVEFHLERQRQVFDRSEAPAVTMVLNAAVLARLVGDEQVIADQREHLLWLDRLERVRIGVLPWTVDLQAVLLGTFRMCEFDDPATDPTVVYHEFIGGRLYLEKASQVLRYREAFDRLWEASVPLEDYSQ